MRKAKRSHRLTALALSVLMVLTMTPVTASAQGVGNDGTAGEIIAFEALPQKTQQQTVSLGTALEDLDLPGSLNATMRIEAAADTEEPEQEGTAPPVLDSGEPAQGNEIPGDIDGDIFADGEQQIGTPSDVQEPQQQSSDQPIYLDMSLPVPAEWASSPAYDGDTAGVYTFTAEIEGFTLSAELPKITVTVGTPAGVITAFEGIAEEIRWQSVEYGTAWEDLNLPQTLSATVEGEAAEVPVDWQADPTYDASAKGLYLLTAQLAEGFSATAELPYIAVVVRAEQPKIQLRGFGGGAKSTDPFLIGTAAQLAEIATLTNEGRLENMFLGTSGGTVYLKLDNDIDLSGYTEDGGWVPIGWYDTTTNTDYAFKGSFDGDGHVITGLYINRSDSNYQGLFGRIAGTVQNLGVVEVNITGKISVGGVAGAVSGTVQSCYSTGSVSGGNSVGGVAGNVSGTVQSCYSTGSVEGIDYVGGVVGRLVTRGGEPYPTVSNCYATGSVTGSGKNVGGVVGDALGGNSSAKVSVKNCAALNPSVSGEHSVGRVVGYGNDSAIFESNIAFSGMTVTVNGSAQTPVAGADKIDGESKSAAAIKADGTLGSLFTNANGWTTVDGKLPGFGAAIEMPAHIIDITSGYFNGKGTVESPYEISTPQQLAKLAELVNAADPDYNSKYYILMNDLDLSAYGKDYNDGKGWVPIGKNDSNYPFMGNFNGNYKTITGLYINRADIYQGLFGVVSGTVKNLGVNEADITGGNICGGITGRISGTVENCFVTGKIHGSSSDIGGIAGVTIGTVKNCYSSAEISSSSARVGGIAGQVITGAKIENCYSTGSVSGKEKVGGIAGVTNGTVQNCAALNPQVSGSGNVGRVMGSGSAALENNIAFSGMTVTVNNTPQTITDGAADNKNGVGKTAESLYKNTEDVLSNLFTEANGWTYTAGSLPILTGFAEGVQDASMPAYLLPVGTIPFKGTGATGDPYLIKTPADLARLAELVNAGTTFYGKYLWLENNLDLSGYTKDGGWVPIGKDSANSFSGSFDGDGHVITGLYINRLDSDYQGLFGRIAGTVKNLGVANANITGKDKVGGVAGYVNGKVQNCYVTGSVSGGNSVGGVAGDVNGETAEVKNCYSTGSVSGQYYVGGIAGYVNGVVREVIGANAEVKNCYSTGSVSGQYYVGGIAGSVFYAAKVQNCYSSGKVAGTGTVGGIAGFATNGTVNYPASEIVHCYSTSDVEGKGTSGGIVGTLVSSTVKNCAALNASVSGLGKVGRVAGNVTNSSSTLQNNYAYSGMDCTSAGDFYNDGTELSSATLFGKNGSFWTTAANWNSGAWSGSVWDFADGKLPTLKGIAGQSGAPDLYLLNLSTDRLSVSLSGTDVITGNGTAASPYTALASYDAQTVNVTVTGWENWTDPTVTITAKKAVGGDINVTSGTNGSGTFDIPAEFSGNITVTAASVSNPNNKTEVTLTVNKRNLTEADFSGVTIPTNHVYNGLSRGIGTVNLPTGTQQMTIQYNGNPTVPTNAGEYAVTLHYAGGTVYNATKTDGFAIGYYTIDAKPITITGVTATDRTYDGTTSVTLSSGTLSGVVDDDSNKVGFTLNTGTITDANVGDSKEVTTNITLTGDRADNYTLTQPTNVKVNIAKKELNLGFAAVADKEYDGTNTATVTGVEFSGLVGQETLEFCIDYTVTGMFDSADVGTGKTVTVTPVLSSTKTANNYRLGSVVTGVTASITPKTIGGTVFIDVTPGSGDADRIDEGDTLTANISDITPIGATLSYQWYRNETEISGATGVSYTIAARATDPVGSLITVKVTGTGNYSSEKTSEAIVIDKIALVGSVSVDGTTTLGGKLTLNTASLTPSDATTSIVWLRDGAPIDGETGGSYTIVRADLGKAISVSVTGTGEYSGTQTAQIDVPAVVPEAPTNFMVSVGNRQLTLNWTAPFDGGSEITKYQLSTDGGKDWQDIGVVTTYTITGLTNGTAYTVKLRAVNGIGEGPDASVTATPVRPYSGGDGGGSSNDNSSSVIVTPPAPDQPNAPTQGEIKVSGTVDGSGNLTASITEQSITAAIDRVLAQARQSGAEQNGISLVLNVGTGSNQPINTLSFNLPKAVQDALIAKGVASVTFAVGNQNNTMLHISIDLAALKEISRQANGNVNLTATRINSGKLTGEGKKAIGSRPVFDLKASYGSGRQVQNFGACSVSVTIPYVLGTGENVGNIQAVYVDANGRVQWLISSVYDRINGVLRFSTNHFSTYGVGYKQDAPSFTDISNHWAKDDIAFVANRGLFSGTSETTFSPNTAMTRGMFVTALGRLANADVSGYKKSSFSDVKTDAYYMGYIEWANQNSIVNGVGNERFAPDQAITREQMAVMMSNYAKVIGFALPKVHAENTFADSAKISAYAKEAVKQMQMAGVISGKNSNLLDPQGTATRAEVSAVLRRFVELAISSDTAQGWTMNDSGKWMYYENGKPVTGKKDIGGSTYTFDQYGVTADVPKNLRYTTYTVQKGDSFWLIAHKLGCTMSELERLNNKSRFDLIHPGDVLRVSEK